MSVAENLYAAYYEMKARGFTKHTQQNDVGQVCAFGALSLVMVGQPFRVTSAHLSEYARSRGYVSVIREHALLLEVAEMMFPDRRRSSIALFNNHDDTTMEDMLAVFWKAALIAEERGL